MTGELVPNLISRVTDIQSCRCRASLEGSPEKEPKGEEEAVVPLCRGAIFLEPCSALCGRDACAIRTEQNNIKYDTNFGLLLLSLIGLQKMDGTISLHLH